MTKSINVVTTCVKRKVRATPDRLHFRHVPGTSLGERAREWIDRLESDPGETYPAVDVYGGDHWSTVRTFEASAQRSRYQVRLWIVSAGYGLISAQAPVHSYSATFSVDHPDSVLRAEPNGSAGTVSQADARRTWWQTLSAWTGPEDEAPRSLADLATRYPRTPLVVAASPIYLSALRSDLEGACAALATTDQLSVISAGCSDLGPVLSEQLVPCDGRLRNLLGGAMHSLNARITAKVLTEADRWEPRASVLKKRYERLLATQDELQVHNRIPMNDVEVRSYIQRALEHEPLLKCSPLLRRLRDGGRACEQKRFSALYRSVASEITHAR